MTATITYQPPLPFSQYQVSRLAVYLLHLANSAEYRDKRDWFYPFKDRWLLKHALFDGYDVQTIERKCWSCGGTGIWGDDFHGYSICYRCEDGIFRTDHIALQRWLVRGSLFHIPRRDVFLELVTVRESISGLIQHRKVHPIIGEIAFGILLARYEPCTLCQLIRARWRDWRFSHYNPIWGHLGFTRKFIRDAVHEASPSTACDVDDIPF